MVPFAYRGWGSSGIIGHTLKANGTLLRVRDPLAGDAVLNWSADVKISDWQGVGIEGSPPRVIRLVLHGLTPSKLTGVIPPELGDLTNLEWLIIDSNSLSGSIPPELGNLANLSPNPPKDRDGRREDSGRG